MSQRKPVAVFGLDAAPPALLETWMQAGHLENFSRLKEKGVYGYVKNYELYSTDVAWTTFASGCSPSKTGYWTAQTFVEGTYNCKTRAAYDYQEFPPFFALGDDYRVAAFDVPQIRLNQKVNGLQVEAWGAHSPQVPSGSLPEPLFQEIIDTHGEHPGLHKDYAVCLDLKSTLKVEEMLLTGLDRREEICKDILSREQWDLFVTVFGETHGGGHNFWHLSQPDHPYYELLRSRIDHDPLLAVYKRIDRALGNILDTLSDDTTVVIFSSHGMGPGRIDLPTIAFLPEFLYRMNFPGKTALGGDKPAGSPLAPVADRMQMNYWERDLWITRHDDNPVRRWLRRYVPNRLFPMVEPWLEPKSTPDNPELVSWLNLLRQPGDRLCPWMPSLWYQDFWPHMRAFALPSFEAGQIRINLKGREPNGLVDPADYHAYCDELIEKLGTLKDARTGTPMVQNVIRMRKDPQDRDPKLHHADLLIEWQKEVVSDVVESAEYGQIGPYPIYRAGNHTADAFMLAYGPGIPKGETLPGEMHSLDITPTILDLMGAPIPEHMEGKPISLRQDSLV